MANKNDSLALDLDLFDNTKNGYVPAERVKKAQKPRLVRPKKKSKVVVDAEIRNSRIAAIKVLTISVVTLIVLGSVIYGLVMQTNLKLDIAKETKDLEMAQSENVRLQMRFNSMMSLDKVEEYAQSELGMVKRENYKVNYFDISDNDGAVLTKSGK